MRRLAAALFCSIVLSGCGPAVPRDELGTVLGSLPELPGADEPYEMPELDPPAAASQQSAASEDSG